MTVVTRKRDDYLLVAQTEREPVQLRDVTLTTISLDRDVSLEHDEPQEPLRWDQATFVALVIAMLVLIALIVAAMSFGWAPGWVR